MSLRPTRASTTAPIVFYRERMSPVGRRSISSARRTALVGATCCASVLLAACTGGSTADPETTPPPSSPTTSIAPRADDGILHLGAFLPLTGPGASLGTQMVDAVTQAVDEINAAGGVLGRPVDLTTVDENDVGGVDELLAAGVDGIVGPASSLVALSQLAKITQPVTGVVSCSPAASALALDGFPDRGLFFRTVPSDSLQMAAIAKRAGQTGVATVAVGYLDDPYGRGLARAFAAEAAARYNFRITAQQGFGADQNDLTPTIDALLADSPGVIVVLGDADDGSRLLAALDRAVGDDPPEEIIVNDAIRSALQTVQQLSPRFRSRIVGVAPRAAAPSGAFSGSFTANAVDCVNLIALAATQADSDSPSRIQKEMAAVSTGGRECSTFADCAETLAQPLRIDYTGFSGGVDLSTVSGDLSSGVFELFGFDLDGTDISLDETIRVP